MIQTNGIKGKSAWSFATSSTGSIGVEFVTVEGGKIYLKDPKRNAVEFTYGAAGVGLAVGFKLPKIGKVHIPVKGKSVTGNVAPAAFPNTGRLYVMDACPGSDLTRDDITGVCMFAEISGGLIAGGSGMAMLVGASKLWLAACIYGSTSLLLATLAPEPIRGLIEEPSIIKLINSATGLLLVAGLNLGVQYGGGLAGYIGGLY